MALKRTSVPRKEDGKRFKKFCNLVICNFEIQIHAAYCYNDQIE
jgi:hypothetical protein